MKSFYKYAWVIVIIIPVLIFIYTPHISSYFTIKSKINFLLEHPTWSSDDISQSTLYSALMFWMPDTYTTNNYTQIITKHIHYLKITTVDMKNMLNSKNTNIVNIGKSLIQLYNMEIKR